MIEQYWLQRTRATTSLASVLLPLIVAEMCSHNLPRVKNMWSLTYRHMSVLYFHNPAKNQPKRSDRPSDQRSNLDDKPQCFPK